MLWICKESYQVLKRDCNVGRKLNPGNLEGKANWETESRIKLVSFKAFEKKWRCKFNWQRFQWKADGNLPTL